MLRNWNALLGGGLSVVTPTDALQNLAASLRDVLASGPCTVPDLDGFMDEHEAAGFLCLSVRTLQAWRSREVGPRFVRMGRAVRYRRRDLIEFARGAK